MSNVSRLQDLKGTEHFRHWHQEKVAKIVHCGEPFYFCRCLEGKTLPHSTKRPVTTKAQKLDLAPTAITQLPYLDLTQLRFLLHRHKPNS